MMKNLLLFSVMLVALISPCHAFWGNTHERIAERSVLERESLLDDKMKEVGLTDGINEVFGAGDVRFIMQSASKAEDNGTRYRNHFYNPLDASGLNDIFTGYSSYVWANEISSGWSWRNARQSFCLGFTAPSDSNRRAALADSFRALGQVMHLIQDKAVPAHVRNDLHMIPDGFEAYASENVDALNFAPVGFAGPKYSVSPYAPRQLWDSAQYDGTNPSASAAIGLAEYTNANFVSEDTIFTENNLEDLNPLNDMHYFPYPRREDTVVFAESQNKTWNGFDVYRKYFEKVGGGQPIKHFATASRLYAYLLDDPEPSIQGFDDKCYKDYASLLIPRAVGYSAALIDYFFRGKLKMEADPANPGQYSIKNESDEEMSGYFQLYYDDASGSRKPVSKDAKWDLSIPAHGTSTPVTFTAPSDAKEAGRYMMVFYGTMGAEKEAVVGSVFNAVPKPPPYVFISSQRLGYQDVNSESIGSGAFAGVLWDYKKDEEVLVYEADGITQIKPPYFLGSPGWDYPHNRYRSGGARRLPEGIAFKLGLEKWKWTRGVSFGGGETCIYPEWTSCKDSENPNGSYALPWSCGPMPYGASREMDGTCDNRHLSSDMVTYGWLPNSPDIVYKGIYHYDNFIHREGFLPIISYALSSYVGVNLSQDFPIGSDLIQYSPYGYLNLVADKGRSFLNEHVSYFDEDRSEVYKKWSINVLAVQFERALIDKNAGESGYDYSNNAWKILNMSAIKSAVSDSEYNWDTESSAYIDLMFPTENDPEGSDDGGSNPREEVVDPPESTSRPPDDLFPIVPIVMDPPLEVDGSSFPRPGGL